MVSLDLLYSFAPVIASLRRSVSWWAIAVSVCAAAVGLGLLVYELVIFWVTEPAYAWGLDQLAGVAAAYLAFRVILSLIPLINLASQRG